MKSTVSRQTWKGVSLDRMACIKQWLIDQGAQEVKDLKSPYELWRMQFLDTKVTAYKKGTLYIADSFDPEVRKIHKYIEQRLGAKFSTTDKKYRLGFDEAGKGEVFGCTVLVGVILPENIVADLIQMIGPADTKQKKSMMYWEEMKKKIDSFQAQGLKYMVEKIIPEEFDRYNINKLFDKKYQSIVRSLSTDVSLQNSRIVIDNYGVGKILLESLNVYQEQGADIVVEQKADDRYLEVKIASLIAKFEQQKELVDILKNKNYWVEGQSIGSGNVGDEQTKKWLLAWKSTGQAWPWFVKKSFKNVRALDGKNEKIKKQIPTRNDQYEIEGI